MTTTSDISYISKTYIPDNEEAPASQIGATLEALAHTIRLRRDADESSYTYRLLSESPISFDGCFRAVWNFAR